MTSIVYHLIDSKQDGIEERVRTLIRKSEMTPKLEHRFHRLEKGTATARHLDTNRIISHLSVSWRTFPFFVTLRALNPKARMVHIEFESSDSSALRLNGVVDRSNSLLRCTYALFDSIILENRVEARGFKAGDIATDRIIRVLSQTLGT